MDLPKEQLILVFRRAYRIACHFQPQVKSSGMGELNLIYPRQSSGAS